MQLPQNQSPAQFLKIPGERISWIFLPHCRVVQAQRRFPHKSPGAYRPELPRCTGMAMWWPLKMLNVKPAFIGIP